MFLITSILILILILFSVYLKILYSHKELSHFKFNVCINKDQNVYTLKNVIKGEYVVEDPIDGCNYSCDSNLDVPSGITNIDLINKAAGKINIKLQLGLFITPIIMLLLAIILISNKEGIEEFLENTGFDIQEWFEEEHHSAYTVLIFMLVIIAIICITYHLSETLGKKIKSYMVNFSGESERALDTLRKKLLIIGHIISTLLLITALLLIRTIIKSIDN
jgi:hypothetical protein